MSVAGSWAHGVPYRVPTVTSPGRHSSEVAVPLAQNWRVSLHDSIPGISDIRNTCRTMWMARKFILCFFRDRLHAIVPAVQEDSRLDGEKERPTHRAAESAAHRFLPQQREQCVPETLLCSWEARWWAAPRGRSRVFQ